MAILIALFNAVVCLAILAFNAVAVINAGVASESVTRGDEKVKKQTSFVKLATVTAEDIMNREKSETAKAECKRVCEALRHSYPMGNDDLSVKEEKITVNLDEFSAAVNAAAENVTEIADEVVLLVGEKINAMC